MTEFERIMLSSEKWQITNAAATAIELSIREEH
jgi:hypothetical protein